MAGMRILHTADIHLKTPEDERWEALRTVLEKAKGLKADALVISGDMFDKHADAQRLKTQLRELFDPFPVPVVILPGNHDRKGLGTGDFYGEKVTVLADISRAVDIGDVRIVGLPFEDVSAEAVMERLLSFKTLIRDQATNILLYHGELVDMIPGPGAFGDEEEHEYMPARLAAFEGLGFDYVLAGHFHRGFDVRRYDGGYFVYPGSPVSVTKKELGIRNVNLVETGKPPQPVAIDTLHAVELDVRLDPFESSNPLDDIRALLRDVHPQAAVYLNVSGFANVEKMGQTEAGFESEIRQFANENSVRTITTRWRDVGAILDHELFKRFNARLEDSPVPLEDRETMRAMVIDAFTETLHEG
jgi:DNA repair exonuclease SbcCD nuclease subunit